jgi:hypothetical protein
MLQHVQCSLVFCRHPAEGLQLAKPDFSLARAAEVDPLWEAGAEAEAEAEEGHQTGEG